MTPFILCPPPDCSDSDTPSIHTEATATEPTTFFIHFQCTATAQNAVATRTEVVECYLDDRLNNRREDAPPATSDSNTAATVGHAAVNGGSDLFNNDDTWLCYSSSATFADGSVNADDLCRRWTRFS
jgi:hypothetical protein